MCVCVCDDTSSLSSQSNGWSSLHYSADNGDVDTTQALLKAGVDPQLKDQVLQFTSSLS